MSKVSDLYRSKDSEQMYIIGMVFSMFLWGWSWATGKIIAGYALPITIALYRFVITYISMFLIVYFAKIKFKIDKSGIKDLLIASAFIALYSFLFFKGLVLGKAGAGGVLVTMLNPIISYAIMLVINIRKPTPREVVGITLGIVATIIMLQIWSNWHNIFHTGNIYFLFAALTWALLSLYTSKASKYGSPIAFSFWMYGIAAILIATFADWKDCSSLLLKADYIFWINMLFSATITTALATTFFFFVTTKIGASKASSYIFLVPFTAIFGSWLILSEIPTWNTLLGGIIGVLAVYVLNSKVKELSKTQEKLV